MEAFCTARATRRSHRWTREPARQNNGLRASRPLAKHEIAVGETGGSGPARGRRSSPVTAVRCSVTCEYLAHSSGARPSSPSRDGVTSAASTTMATVARAHVELYAHHTTSARSAESSNDSQPLQGLARRGAPAASRTSGEGGRSIRASRTLALHTLPASSDWLGFAPLGAASARGEK